MARCGVPEQIIAQYAGHRSIETTRIYIHMSGRDISASVAQKMEDFNRWVEASLAAMEP
jgi:integrase/recombinase XerD